LYILRANRLDGDKITDAAVGLFAQCLPELKSLTKFYLGGKEIGNVGAESLAEAVRNSSIISSVCLSKRKVAGFHFFQAGISWTQKVPSRFFKPSPRTRPYSLHTSVNPTAHVAEGDKIPDDAGVTIASFLNQSSSLESFYYRILILTLVLDCANSKVSTLRQLFTIRPTGNRQLKSLTLCI
jgi:hypothetical protein